MRGRRVLVGLAAAVLGLGLVWVAGFAVFAQMARGKYAGTPPSADGIVVLTGGAERIETGLHLLEQGLAPRLLVSGVGHGTDIADVARRVHLSPDLAARVTLGRVATTTLGNAAETANWARAHGARRLILVTAGYHMPRALVEIGRALPGVALYPVPVRPPAMRGGMELATVRMLANEYDKYLFVRFWAGSLGLPRRTEAEAS